MLSNVLRIPIHIYELGNAGLFRKYFRLRLTARIGSPLFDHNPLSPICILSADGRFPQISPGQQKTPGDHFLSLFPSSPSSAKGGLGFDVLLRRMKILPKGGVAWWKSFAARWQTGGKQKKKQALKNFKPQWQPKSVEPAFPSEQQNCSNLDFVDALIRNATWSGGNARLSTTCTSD